MLRALNIFDDEEICDLYQKSYEYWYATKPRVDPVEDIQDEASPNEEPLSFTQEPLFSDNVDILEDESLYRDVKIIIADSKTISLSRVFLGRSSETLKGIIDKENSSCLITIRLPCRAEDDKDTFCEVMTNSLKSFYGKPLAFTPSQYAAAYTCSKQLKIKFKSEEDDFQPRLRQRMLDNSARDCETGLIILKKCMMYDECSDVRNEIARLVLTLRNMSNNYELVVDDCLMSLPPEMLEFVEYGRKHGRFSVFALRYMYVCRHEDLSVEEKCSIMDECIRDRELSPEEVLRLRGLQIQEPSQMLEIYHNLLCTVLEEDEPARGDDDDDDEGDDDDDDANSDL